VMGSTVRGRGYRALLMLLSACAAMAGCDSSGAGSSAAAAGGASATPGASPAPTVVPASTPSVTPSTSAASAVVKPKISKAGLSYFFTIALGTEYGGKSASVVRWERPVAMVRVHGGSGKSRSCLNTVISDFNALTATTDLKLTKDPADVELYFAPVSKFRSLDSSYVAGNDGFFSNKWSSNMITTATVLIRTTGIGEGVRCHLIREELTQAMGLGRDSNKYPSSVFYGQYWSAPTRYSKLDREIIRLLYSGAVHPGDTKNDVTRAVTVK
jgi:hypothetical protein